MATLSFGTDDPLTTKRWARKVEREMLPSTLMGTLGGRSATNAFYLKDDLEKNAGDRIRVPYLRLLSDGTGLPLSPIEGQQSPEGLERAQQYQDEDVEIDMTSQAVRFWRVISDQRTEFSARDDAKEVLKRWWADYIDVVALNHAAGNTAASSPFSFHNPIVAPDSDHQIWAGGTVTADENLTSADIMTTKVLDDMIFTAETQTQRGNPAMERASGVVGGSHWVVVISHEQHKSLIQDPDSREALEIAPMQGGEIDRNTLRTQFRGVGLRFFQFYRDAAIFVSHRIPKGVNSGIGASQDNTRRAVLLGGLALCGAFGRQTPGQERFAWTEWNFPYNREMGVDAMLIGGIKTFRINGKNLAAVVGSTWVEEF